MHVSVGLCKVKGDEQEAGAGRAAAVQGRKFLFSKFLLL
jgi:hypothetical protein